MKCRVVPQDLHVSYLWGAGVDPRYTGAQRRRNSLTYEFVSLIYALRQAIPNRRALKTLVGRDY